MKSIVRFFKYSFIFLLLGLLVPVMLMLGIEKSSQFFSWIAMKVGPKLKRHKVVLKNLELCFPEMKELERTELAIKTWSNLGAIFGEILFFKLMTKKQLKKRTKIEDRANAFSNGKKIYVFSHLSNFEVFLNLAVLYKDVETHGLFSAPKNVFILKLIRWLRERENLYLHANHSSKDLKSYIRALIDEKVIWMLVDQESSKGVGIDSILFGHHVKTTSLPAQLTLKYSAPIYMVRVIRTGLVRYTIRSEQLALLETDTIQSITQKINDRIEEWVKEYPEDWAWLHKRFDKSLY
ncbi:MAG: Lipid A biosynthesis lauroyltransferase [Holosporales bacterium]